MSLETRIESRLPSIVAIVSVLVLLEILPARYRLAPAWFPYVGLATVIASMAAVMLAPSNRFYATVERIVIIFFCSLVTLLNVMGLARLVADMVTHQHGYGSLTLLESSVGIWFQNIIAFALLYWQLDGGGPLARAAGSAPADFHFSEAEHWESRWQKGKPDFMDYLFLAFSTATSFTAAEPRPVSARAQLLMMLEALISLTTLFVVAARAIGTLS